MRQHALARDPFVSDETTAVADETTALMAEEVRASLLAPVPYLPSKYFYDDRGSRLFERITGLEEYYQTRTEEALLRTCASNVVAHVVPQELVELGGGVSRKVRVLLDAMRQAGTLRRCVLFDIHRGSLESSLAQLRREYRGLAARGIVGDFQEDVTALGAGGGRLIAFLGGTIGNLHPDDEVPGFLGRLRQQLADGDGLLVGVDLVKDTARLERAYNDDAGVTAAFNLNLLRVVNERLGADFNLREFEHVAFYDEERAWIEMRVRARSDQQVRIPAAGVTLRFDADDELRTEISCKYTRESLSARLQGTGLRLATWYTDPERLFGLALLVPEHA
jgi:L-histidine N-alpha-methyltransferase